VRTFFIFNEYTRSSRSITAKLILGYKWNTINSLICAIHQINLQYFGTFSSQVVNVRFFSWFTQLLSQVKPDPLENCVKLVQWKSQQMRYNGLSQIKDFFCSYRRNNASVFKSNCLACVKKHLIRFDNSVPSKTIMYWISIQLYSSTLPHLPFYLVL
jgi:hypothetical protein